MARAAWQMGEAQGTVESRPIRARGTTLDWRKRMSDNVACALLVYTALQILVTMNVLKAGHGSVLPYLSLIVLVVAIIPACRAMERRWSGLTDRQADNPELADRFRRDRLTLWLGAIGLPLAITCLLKGLLLLF